MLNGWHVQWVCWPCKNWDVFSFQELCTDPCNMGLCIIMLQHEVMDVDEWTFWQFVQKLFGHVNRLLQQLSGWLVSDDLGGEDAGCGGPGLVWLHVDSGCAAGWMFSKCTGCTAKFSETPLETAYGREMNIQFTANSSRGHSCSQHANCTLP